MDAPTLLAIALVASLSAVCLALLWVAIRQVHEHQPTVDVSHRSWSSGSLQVMDRDDKVAWTVTLDGALRRALFRLGPLKLRLLALRFGLVDGDPMSRADAAWVLHRSEEEVAVIESYALGRLALETRTQLENLNVPRQPPRRPDSGGYQTSGRPLPVKPIPPSLSASAEVDLPESAD